MAVLKPYSGDYYLWKYLPSIPAAVIFAVLFAIAAGLIGARMFQTRTWFCIPLMIGVTFELMGYIFRVVSQPNTSALIPYILQSILLLVAPALYAASVYMVLGRLIRHIHAERQSMIRTKWMTKIFVTGDVLSFLIQGSGGGLLASSDRNSAIMGNNLIKIGLAVQIVLFGLFFLSAVIFNVRAKRAGIITAGHMTISWQRLLYMLYAVSTMILVRSVFRLVEYIAGQDGYLLRHEWTLYTFDALLMWATTMVFWWWYPAGINAPEGSLESGLASDRSLVAVAMSDHAAPKAWTAHE